MKAWLVWIIAAASATAATQFMIEHRQVTLEGQVTATGALLAYIQDNAPSQPWQLQAQRVEVAVDSAKEILVQGASLQRETGTTYWNQSHIAAHAHATDQDHYLGVFTQPHTQVHATAGCLEMDAAHGLVAAREVVATNKRSMPTAIVDDALRVTSCNDEIHVTVTGDFVIVLWEWSATLQSLEDAFEARSGRQAHYGDGTNGLNDIQQTYIQAYNATLTIPLANGRWYASTVGSLVEGTATFRDYLLVDLDKRGVEGTISGTLGLDSLRRENQVASQVEAHTLHDSDLYSAPVNDSSSDHLPWLLVLVASTGFLAWLRRRRRDGQEGYAQAQRHLDLAHEALGQQRVARAAYHARRATRLDPSHAYAWQLLANALRGRGRSRASLRSYRRAYDLHREATADHDNRFQCAYEAARAAAAFNSGQAIWWLHVAISHHPRFAGMARLEPDFEHLHAFRSFRDLVRGPVDIS